MKLTERLKNSRYFPAATALLAAALFGLNAPLSKVLLNTVSPMYMVAFLYLGAGIGMTGIQLFAKTERRVEAPLSRRELPWTVSMILLDILAPFLLMTGLRLTSAANASLLFNFEMVATSLIAMIFFREAVGRRIWFSLGVITAASVLLSIDFSDSSAWRFSSGSLLVLGACSCWGLENNCTRNMSAKSPAEIVIVKGFGAGLTALAIAFLTGDVFPRSAASVFAVLLLGFIAYGLSIFFYVKAQRFLGAARTSAYYAAAPFIGVVFSMAILYEMPDWKFAGACVFMLFGVWIAIREKHVHKHFHEKLTHNHAHLHDDLHHNHVHNPPVTGWHSHEHTHECCEHEHPHTPDIHHRHGHGDCTGSGSGNGAIS